MVFDNDGTLCCEKPLPVQLDFILPPCRNGRSGAGTAGSPTWKAAYERDYNWLAAKA